MAFFGLILPVAVRLSAGVILLSSGVQAASLSQSATTPAVQEPASFEGVLPCADCPGIAWHLDLWPEGRYHLQRTYLERVENANEIGRWRVNPADDSLLLFGARDAPLRLEVKDAQTLRLLDLEGRHIKSQLPYELFRLDAFAPAEMSLPLWGEFHYFADAASLLECRTGQRYPVLMEGDYLSAERRYLALQQALPQKSPQESQEPPGTEDLFVHIDARIVNQQAHEGEGPVQSLRIERFVGEVPGLRCEPPEQMALETRFQQALGQVRRWQIVSQTLELFDKESRSLLFFEAVYLP